MKNDDGRPQSAYEEYLATDFSDDPGESVPSLALDRRQFLQLVGGGILVAISVRHLEAVPQREGGRGPGQRLPEDFNAFLRIGEDGRVTGYTGKIEMGQGVITSLPQMLADELDVPLASVDMVMGDTDLCPWTWEPSVPCPHAFSVLPSEPLPPKLRPCWLNWPPKNCRWQKTG